MRKRAGKIMMSIGAVLLMSALLLFIYNKQEDKHAGQEAEFLLGCVKEKIEQSGGGKIKVTAPKTGHMEESEAVIVPEMTVVEIEGYGYIGYLTIVDLQLELPVMAEWDYDRLKIAPCRQFGATGSDDLVLAAHNYKSHFGELSQLKKGAEICFTDMDGNVNYYRLVKLETLEPNEVDAVLKSEYDLVLYTCTPGGATRVVAFCERVELAEVGSNVSVN